MLRMAGDRPFVTDEGNAILDLHLGTITDAQALSVALNQIPGVVENGLFIGMADLVVIGHTDGRAELVEARAGSGGRHAAAPPTGRRPVR